MDAKQMMDDLKRNSDALASCSWHDFATQTGYQFINGRRIPAYRCSHCGGCVDELAKFWYELGREHGQDTHRR